MNTTGVRPFSFVFSMCFDSYSLMLAMSWPPSSVDGDVRWWPCPAENAAVRRSRSGSEIHEACYPCRETANRCHAHQPQTRRLPREIEIVLDVRRPHTTLPSGHPGVEQPA